jgi:hypothetical protein
MEEECKARECKGSDDGCLIIVVIIIVALILSWKLDKVIELLEK